MASTSYSLMAKGYENLWKKATLSASKAATATAVAKKIIGLRDRYEPVAKRMGNPKIWPLIGAIHNREASLSFAGVLHNGEHIIGTGRKTSLVPAGRGPFSSWENAAVDALALKGWNNIKDWPISRWLYESERYNGWGYYLYHGVNSPYVWGGTSLQQRGKYVSDGKWSSGAWDSQLGTAAILKALFQIDPTLDPGYTPPPVSPVVVTTTAAAGAVVASIPLTGSLDPAFITGAGIALAAALAPWIKDTYATIKLSATAESAKKGTTSVDGTKNWTQSLGIWGGVIAAAAPAVAAIFGYTMTPADVAQVTAVAGGLGSAVGGLLAVIGRVRATKAIAG